MNTSRVTVYIPTRNRSGLLRRAVGSVLSQSYADLEIIIVDDASDDDTETVVNDLIAANDTSKSIVYHRLSTLSGACAARNVAIQAATGEFITGLDDDDYFLPDRILHLVNSFDPQKYSFVFCGYIRETVKSNGKSMRTAVRLTAPARFPDLLQRNVVGNQVLTLTERMRAVGGFDTELPAWQDYDMWIRLVRQFGVGIAAGGVTYVQTISHGIPRISVDLDKVGKAFDIFCLKHPEYEDVRMTSCLRLSKACYGINALQYADLLNFIMMGRPRLIASSWYFFLANKVVSRK